MKLNIKIMVFWRHEDMSGGKYGYHNGRTWKMRAAGSSETL
jgi:hypothetical protein